MRRIESSVSCIKLSKSINPNYIRISEAHTSMMFRIGLDGMEFLYPHYNADSFIKGVDVI